MAANKVIVNNQTIIDLTADTVTAATLKKGVTAHDASGAQITGTLESGGGSTSETWVLNKATEFPLAMQFAVNFNSNGKSFTSISAGNAGLFYGTTKAAQAMPAPGAVLVTSSWYMEAYRKLVFDTPPTGDLLTWLTANGVKQPANLAVQPSKDVTITSNGTTEITPDAPYDVMEKANLTVNVPTGGGTTAVSPKDINFYDYDGTCVAAWSLSELAGKTALPDYPTHEGLTCQGWNWTLEAIKALNRPVTVGAMYITDDGATRLHIRIATVGRMTVPLYIGQTVSNGVSIDWGDGSTTQTLSGTGNVNTSHTYTEPGDYIISLMPQGGCKLSFGNGSSSYCVMGSTGTNGKVYCNMLQDVSVGKNVTSIGTYAFYNCYSLASITIPTSVTSIGGSAFQSCYSLASITIPTGVTSIGDYALQNCYSLASITIPTGVTSIGVYAFAYCYSLASITIPTGVTSIGNATFTSCYSLSSITTPTGVTSIGRFTFQNCSSLASITIPTGVTSIGDYAFAYCFGMRYYDFSACTAIPALSSKNAFDNISSDCQMLIPSALYNNWKTATNWATYASKMVSV